MISGVATSESRRAQVISRGNRFGRVATRSRDDRAGEGHEGILLEVQPLVRPMVAVARKILGSDDLAWDAVQEALLSLWLEAEPPANLRPWLIRTVIHRSLHLSRSRARRRKHEERAAQGRPESSRHDEPSQKLEGEELERLVHRALLGITRDHREILILSLLSDMDYASLAEHLRIPPGTVRSRLNRSRKALRLELSRLLSKDDHDDLLRNEPNP